MLKKSEKIIIVKRVTKEDLNPNNDDEIKKHSFWSDLNKNWLSLSPIIRDFLLKGLWELIKKLLLILWNFLINDN